MKNYYKILGVSKNASVAEIKKAYRTGALFWHPDKNSSLNAKDKFIEIQEAYEILIDLGKKSIYDSLINIHKQKTNQRDTYQDDSNDNNSSDYQQFNDWIFEIRRKAEQKATIPFLDDILTETFHFLDKYGILLFIAFALISFILATMI